MDELCRDLVEPIVEAIDPSADDKQYDKPDSGTPASRATPAPVQPSTSQVFPVQDQIIAPVVLVEAEAVEVRIKTEDAPLALGTVPVELEAANRESINPPVPSISNSFCSDVAPKIEEDSQLDPSHLPPQPWEYVVVARDEEHVKIEELLDCLAVGELQPLVKSLKVRCVSKKVGDLWYSN